MLKNKLTVVIPYYNNLSGLSRLLKTIPNNELDVIVVDDNSEESKNAFLLTKDFPNVKFYQNNSKLSNAGSARNVGLSKVKTPYVMFADSDDYFCESAFDRITELLKSEFDCAFFLTDALAEIDDGKPDRNIYYNELVKKFNEGDESIRYEFVVPWSKVINMRLIKDNDIKFDEVSVSNDMYFSLSVGILAKKILAVEEKVYCVVKNGSGISTNVTKHKSRCRLRVNIRCNTLMMKNLVPYQHFFSTKGVLIRSKLNPINYSEKVLLLKTVRYVLSLLCYRLKYKC
jgi:glycosyltransferase involved in cell wall biosynthesis